MHTSATVVEGVAVGEPVSSAVVRAISLVEASQSSHKGPPAFLAPAIHALKSLPDVITTLKTASDEDGWTVPMNAVADADGVIDGKWFTNDGVFPITADHSQWSKAPAWCQC